METILLILAVLFGSSAAVLDSRIRTIERPVPDQYIVIFNEQSDVTVDVDEVSAIAGRQNIGHVFRNVTKGVSVRVIDPQKLTRILDLPTTAYVQQDGIVNITTQDNDDNRAAMTWGLDRIDQRVSRLDGKAAFTGDGSGVNVYVIDTGIYPDHKYFNGRARVGFDAVDIDEQHGIDCDGHGTHCAGTIGAEFYGVAPAVNLWGVRVLSCEGWGYVSWVIAGIDWVATNHIAPAVASMSLSGASNQACDDAVRNLHDKGVTVVAAAGNNGGDACENSPAGAPSAITVGAIDHRDYRAYFSNFGACVDIFAPGVNVLSTFIGQPTATQTSSGTSMACPHVSGVAALALGNDKTLTPTEVWKKLDADSTHGVLQEKADQSPDKLLYAP